MTLTEEIRVYKAWCEETGRNPVRAESVDDWAEYVAMCDLCGYPLLPAYERRDGDGSQKRRA